MTTEALEALQRERPPRSALVDIQTVTIDTSLPAAQRMQDYLAQIKNPYHFLHGDSEVRIRFAPEGPDLRSRLEAYFISCKQG